MKRRDFLRAGGALALVGQATPVNAEERQALERAQLDGAVRARQRVSRAGATSVVTPNGGTLPLREVAGVKVGYLRAEPLDHEFAPGLSAKCWGYNGGTPGPTIEVQEGDRLRLYVENGLPEPTTVHWHGIILPNGMDGVAGLTQPAIAPGEVFKYEFDLRYPGTFMYHPHYDEMTQIALGMVGMFIVHPRRARRPAVTRDFAMMLQEWRIDVGASRPDPNEMSDFNVLTFNGKAFPGTEPLLVGTGERVRIRFGNLGPMDHHPIHLHGLSFVTTATDGGDIPRSAQRPDTTVLVPVGSTRVIEFAAEEPGDWAMHCHMTHHVMMQMGHGLPNMVGADLSGVNARVARHARGYMAMGTTGMGGMGEMDMPVPPNSLPMRGAHARHGYVDMGGMFSILKVRDKADAQDPAAWYQQPEGSMASPASPEDLSRDGFG